MFFKFGTLGNGSGQLAKIVAILQIKNMPEGSFFVAEVLGLSLTGEASGSGWLMVVPNRCGNKASNTWFHKFVIQHIVEQDKINAALPGSEVLIFYNLYIL